MSVSFTIKEWSMWQAGNNEETPVVKDLPMMLRRRLSRLGKIAMRVAQDVQDGQSVPLVFTSRYGESAQTVKLLQALAENEPLSPAGFSMSVHNGLAGLMSIATKNTQSHTAISAGRASFCNGLMEAICLLREPETKGVLLVHYDEPLPDFYIPFGDEEIAASGVALYLEKTDKTLELCVSGSEGMGTEEESAENFVKYALEKKQDWSWSDGRTTWMIRHAA